MRKVLHLRKQWAQLAGLPPSEQIGLQLIDVQQIDVEQNLKQNDRHSQNAGTRGKAIVAQRVWAALSAGVGDFGHRSGASLTRWTQRH